MRRPPLTPPAIVRPAPRIPSRGSVAAKAQAAVPGCQNPNRTALWAFTGSRLRITEVPKVRYRSQEEEMAALTGGTASRPSEPDMVTGCAPPEPDDDA